MTTIDYSSINMEGTESIFCHIYNRGVDKRNIYECEKDYQRFIDGLKAFNISTDKRPVTDRFVDLLGYCLMPNHFHLLIRAESKEKIAHLMRRLSTGYTMYFNKKYQRSGVLFESSYKSIIIDDESYLLQVSRYIHLNPLALFAGNGWRTGAKIDFDKADEYLCGYHWSSYGEYMDDRLDSDILVKNVLLDIVGGKEKYGVFMRSWDPKNKLDFDED